MDFLTALADIVNSGVLAILLLVQGLICIGKTVQVWGVATLVCAPVVVWLFGNNEGNATPDQHVLKLQWAETLLSVVGSDVTAPRLTAITVSVLGNVIPTALAATSTGHTQRVLGVGVSSDLLAVRLRVKEASAAAVPAAVNSATVRAVGRHLPGASGDRGPGTGLATGPRMRSTGPPGPPALGSPRHSRGHPTQRLYAARGRPCYRVPDG